MNTKTLTSCILNHVSRFNFRHQGLLRFHKSCYNVEIPKISVSDFILQDFNKYRKFTALINGTTGEKTNFGKLESEVISASVGLKNIDLQKDDIVCLYGSNRPEFVHVFCGVTSNGAVLTIASSQLTSEELSVQLKDTRSKLIVATPECAQRAKEAALKAPSVKEVLVLGHCDGFRPFNSLLDTKGDLPDIHINPDTQPALIPFSSGTTGLPKGVILTHQNLVSQLLALRHPSILPFVSGEEKSISCLPMVHIAGLIIGLLNPLSQGAATVVLPRFEPESYLKAIQDYRGTFSIMAPPIVNFLAKDPMADKFDLSSLHTPFSGASTLTKTLTEQMVDRLKLEGIRQGYGMSETSGAIYTDPIGYHKYGSIGKPVPNTEAKLVDTESQETIRNEFETGEIWARGPQVTKGYLHNEEATKNSITQDGWIKTGDIAYFDEDGHYYIVDRLKDIIKYKGYQISPSHLESVLLSHPLIAEAAVVGVPVDVLGEVPKAYVVLKSDASREEIQTFVNERVSPYKRLRGGIEIVQEIPKLPSGKILRRKLYPTEPEKKAIQI